MGSKPGTLTMASRQAPRILNGCVAIYYCACSKKTERERGGGRGKERGGGEREGGRQGGRERERETETDRETDRQIDRETD